MLIAESTYDEITLSSLLSLPIFLTGGISPNLKLCSTFDSSSLEIYTPSLAIALIPLYSGGLCEAVIMTPPL